MKKLAALCIGAVFLVCAGYFALSFYYQDVFLPNTWINGIYCTGRTVEDVNAELVRGTSVPTDITVIGLGGVGEHAALRTWTLSLQELHYSVDYRQELTACFERQNRFLWVDSFKRNGENRISPQITIDEASFLKWWRKLETIASLEEDYRIEYAGNLGYYLYDGLHNRLDLSKAYQVIKNALFAGETQVDLIEAGCYYDVPFTAQQQKTDTLWEKVEFFQRNGPVYDLGDGLWQVEPVTMVDFLVKSQERPYVPITDKKGNLQIDDGKIEEFIDSVADAHDTYGKLWEFESTRGDVVTVQGETYGTTIDREREALWLETYLWRLTTDGASSADKTAHIPEYTREAFCRSCKNFGDTYIEVDMGIQKLYYYEKGELVLETDIVTGNARRRMNTPEGVNFVYNKQKKRVLRGQGYASPVDFWMPVKGAIGIHDAKWRKEFGGDIYKTSGSHGCVNLPRDVMAQLYDMVEIGTPVVMFYGKDI